MYDNNVLYTFVGSTYVFAAPTIEGQVAIQYEDNSYGDGAGGGSTGLPFRFVRYNAYGNLEHSPWVTPGKVLANTVSGYIAPVQDAWKLACDSGVDKDELKSIWLVVKDTLTTFGNKSMMKNAVTKTAVATETGTVIAGKLAASFEMNMVREPEKYATASNSTPAGATAVVASVAGNTITYTTAIPGGLAVGDLIISPSAGLFKVTNIATLVVTVDRVVPSSVDGETTDYLDSAVAGTDLYFYGNSRTNFKPGIWKSMTYTFELLGDDVGTTTHITGGHGGTNTEEQIKEAEWFYQGHRGYGYRVDFIPVDTQLSSPAVYTALTDSNLQKCTYLQWKDQNFVNVVGQEPASLIEAKIYLNDDAGSAIYDKFAADLAASV